MRMKPILLVLNFQPFCINKRQNTIIGLHTFVFILLSCRLEVLGQTFTDVMGHVCYFQGSYHNS